MQRAIASHPLFCDPPWPISKILYILGPSIFFVNFSLLSEFFFDKIPEEIASLCNIEGYRMLYWANRGKREKDHEDMRAVVLFDFQDDEKCPRDIMLKVAKELGFSVAPDFLNTENHTARLSPLIF